MKMERMVKEAQGKIDKALTWLIRAQPFYAVIALSLVPTVRIVGNYGRPGTMATDGKRLYFNPEFVLDQDDFTLRFIILHEVLHIIFRHHLRRAGREFSIYNAAADFEVNLSIVKSAGSRRHWRTADQSYHAPENCLLDWDYDGLLMEDIFDLLFDEFSPPPPPPPEDGECEEEEEGRGGDMPPPPPGGDMPPPPPGEGQPVPGDEEEEGEGEGEGPGSGDEDEGKPTVPQQDWGDVEDLKNDDGSELSEAERDKEEQALTRLIKQATNIAKTRGEMPGDMLERLEELAEPSQAWADVLREMLQDRLPNDYSFARPNRFYLGQDIVMPGTEKIGLGHIGFMIDSSGSVSTDELKQFAAEVNDIFSELEPEKVTLIWFDGVAYDPEEFEPGDELIFEAKGRGGTTFTEPFKKATEFDLDDEFDIVIFLTDGGDSHYPEEPPYPVIWASTGAMGGGGPDFGEFLPIKFD